MNRQDLVNDISESFGLSNAEADRIVKLVDSRIGTELTLGGTVELYGFGKFHTVVTQAKIGRNPHTGEAIEIAATAKIKFTPARQLRDRVRLAYAAEPSRFQPAEAAE